MKKRKNDLLNILKILQVGQVELRSILNSSMRFSMRNILQMHLQEYTALEAEAYAIAVQRGWDLPDLEPGHRFLTDKITRLKLHIITTDSAIAKILIQKNRKDIIHSLKNLHQFKEQDQQIQILSQKLLDCQTAYIYQMQSFL